MNALLLFKGILIGAIISIPVGPIGILCLRRMLTRGPLIGLASGLGATTADVIYALMATLGLSFILSFLEHQFILFRLISSLFFCVVGIRILFLPHSPAIVHPGKARTLLQAYFSTMFITLTNPLTILSFLALFAALGIDPSNFNTLSIFLISLGVFTGSALWWIILAGIAWIFHPSISQRTLDLINKVAGIGLILFGVIALASLVIS